MTPTERTVAACGCSPRSATGFGPGRAPADLRGRIEAAGRPAGLGVREVMAAKVAAALLGGIAAVPLAALAPGRLGIVIAPLAPAAGFLASGPVARAAGGRARPARAP